MSHYFTTVCSFILTLCFPMIALAAPEGVPHLDGATMQLTWAIPFVGMLLSIALFPLIAPHFWHHHFGKISVLWALSFLIPFSISYGFSLALYEILHVVLLEYIPFIVLLFALYTVAGGIRLKGSLVGTPAVNTGLLFLGTCIASITGTTGAAILLIRPLLNANKERIYKVHSVVFFIFLVANIGGSLTPLGDPPLFLGFLNGVSFFWTTQHLFFPMMLTSLILLILYLVIDTLLYRKELSTQPVTAKKTSTQGEPLSVEGVFNFALLGVIIAMVLLSGFWKPAIVLNIYGVPVELQNIIRDIMLIITAFVSLKATDSASRDANGFTWFPIEEVGKLFIGIFITMIAPIAILKAGSNGALKDLIALVSTPNGEPVNAMYFWLTGMLSSFLDNAPTYLVFFNTAGGDANLLMQHVDTLLAISMGAVFMGANSYIGNAPNFMVRSIAEDQGVKMPSFFGYLLWSFGILIPIFILLTVLFF